MKKEKKEKELFFWKKETKMFFWKKVNKMILLKKKYSCKIRATPTIHITSSP